MPDDKAAERELERYYLEIFRHDKRGQAIYKDLMRRYGGAKIFTDGGIEAILKTYRSTAHCEVVEWINDRCDSAEGEGKRSQEGTHDY